MPPRNAVIDRDLGWRGMMRRVDTLRGSAYTKVGILADSARGGLHQQGPDGKAAKLTVAEIAAVNEFGTEDGSIPARPFVRSTFDEMREELIVDSRHLIVAVVLDGRMTATQALNILGLKLATAIRKKITTGTGVPPPNAPTTALLKAMKGRTGRFFKPTSTTLGGVLGDVAATQSAIEAAGGRSKWLLSKTAGIKAARSLGDAFAQIGALASVRTLVDTGRMVGAISWAVVARERQEPEHYVGGNGR